MTRTPNKFKVCFIISQVTDSTQSILTVYNVSLIDEGMYTCITRNVHGNDSATAELRVQGMWNILLH